MPIDSELLNAIKFDRLVGDRDSHDIYPIPGPRVEAQSGDDETYCEVPHTDERTGEVTWHPAPARSEE